MNGILACCCPCLFYRNFEEENHYVESRIGFPGDPSASLILGSPINTTRQLDLMEAARLGDTEKVRQLAQGGDVFVNYEDTRGDSALTLAVQNGHVEVVQILLQNGAEVDSRDHQGRTVLMQAVQKGHVEVVRVLLQEGAEVNAQDFGGKTVLMWASPAVVSLLLEYGADPTMRDDLGNRASDQILHAARDHAARVREQFPSDRLLPSDGLPNPIKTTILQYVFGKEIVKPASK